MIFVEVCWVWKVEYGILFCKIIFFFEGEEESGLLFFVFFMKENVEELKFDIVLICDIGLF